MKRMIIAAAASLPLLLGGCASTIKSSVTTFHQWPAQIADKSYAFEAPAAQDDTLELRSYQDLVRGQLARLGFREAPQAPALKVALRFETMDVPTAVAYPTYVPVPLHAARFGYGPRHRYWGRPVAGPYYAPAWGLAPAYEVEEEHRYYRQLSIAISSAADDKRLFDVTVRNVSDTLSTPALMPALVRSAFEDFPGPNGGARVIELKQEPRKG